MPDPTQSREARTLPLRTLMIGALLAACLAALLIATRAAGGATSALPHASRSSQRIGSARETARAQPRGGIPGPGSRTHPTKAAMEQMLQVTRCMRRHGIKWFPNPVTSVPSSMAGVGMLSDFHGAILVIPSARVIQSGSAYGQAARVCGHGLLGHPGVR